MPAPADVLDLDATGQAALIREGAVSCLELVDAAIARAQGANASLNALVADDFERARDAARRTDSVRRGHVAQAPFAGVPFVVKDLLASCAGLPRTDGTRFAADHRAESDSELVARFRRAGLVVIGLTSASEFGILPTTEPERSGATKNPWSLAHSPGGSSGGSAAMVAARVVAMGHANDWGGSIRIPAACCGLFGLKPTRARNSLAPDFGDLLSGLVHEHAVTRSVRDSAALLDATAGAAPGDPYAAPGQTAPFAEAIRTSGPRLRIALSVASPTGSPVDADCRDAALSAARLCEELGHHVEPADPPSAPDTMLDFSTLYGAGVAALVDLWETRVGRTASSEFFEPNTWALAGLGRHRTAADYLDAVRRLQRLARAVAAFHATYDVLLTPALAEPPAPLGTFAGDADNPLSPFVRAGAYTPFTPLANITGQPSMSVPLCWNDAGLPVGVMFTARFGEEATLFRLATELETARPWSHRKPPSLG